MTSLQIAAFVSRDVTSLSSELSPVDGLTEFLPSSYILSLILSIFKFIIIALWPLFPLYFLRFANTSESCWSLLLELPFCVLCNSLNDHIGSLCGSQEQVNIIFSLSCVIWPYYYYIFFFLLDCPELCWAWVFKAVNGHNPAASCLETKGPGPWKNQVTEPSLDFSKSSLTKRLNKKQTIKTILQCIYPLARLV